MLRNRTSNKTRLFLACLFATASFLWTSFGLTKPVTQARSQEPGTASSSKGLQSAQGLQSPQSAALLSAGVETSGLINYSIDALGTLNQCGTIQVQKPAGATVRSAYMLSATVPFPTTTIANGQITINGAGVTFTQTVSNAVAGGTTNSYFGDVTSIVKPIVDAAAAGIVNLTVCETTDTLNIDGEILVVIFDDPAQTMTNTFILLFGAQNPAGDSFTVFTSPLNPANAIDLSLGISFGFQGTEQASNVDVNGTRLTSSAGGQDDSDAGGVDNGSLITAGGVGDSNANPADPNAGPNGDPRQDDELYNLAPFVTNGATSISISTQNPSLDDNLFFAGLFFRGAIASTTCVVTCPANITVANDPNQCGAVVNYPAPTTSGTCGTVTCSPPTGSFFPVGTTTVTCTATAGPSCTFTVTVNDTQPPTITCPANVTAVAAQTCPISSSATVTFPAPTASDNCPGVVTVCNPPSGSIFPVGTTTVTCTATDASGNTATCSFTVTVFSGCLQDDSNPANVVLFNAVTGEYRFCCNGTVFTGVGTLIVKGCIVTIQHNPADRRVLIKFDGAVGAGSAGLQSPPGVLKCTITDRNTRNNTCVCQ